MSNLFVRSISGLVYALVVLFACFGGRMAQIGLASVLAILAVLEWMKFGQYRIHWLTTILVMFSIFISIYTFSGIFEVGYLQTEIYRGLLAFSIGGILLNQGFREEPRSRSLFHSTFSLIYIGVPMILIPMVGHYHGENRPWMLASVFILIWWHTFKPGLQGRTEVA